MAERTKSHGGELPLGCSPPGKGQRSGYVMLDSEYGERYASSAEFVGHALRDPRGSEIGKVENLYVNDRGEPEYVMVKIGILWRRKAVLIPVESVTLDEERRALVLR